MGVHGGEVAAGPGGQPAPECRELEALGEVAKGEPVGPELGLEHGPEGSGLDPGGPADPVDLDHPVEAGQVKGEDAAERVADVGLHPADHRGAPSVGDCGHASRRAPVEQRHHIGLVGRMGDDVRRMGQVAAQETDGVPVGPTVRVGGPVPAIGRAHMRQGTGRADTGGGQVDVFECSRGPGDGRLDSEPSGQGCCEAAGLDSSGGGLLPTPPAPGPGASSGCVCGGAVCRRGSHTDNVSPGPMRRREKAGLGTEVHKA